MPNDVKLSFALLRVIMVRVVMLSVAAFFKCCKNAKLKSFQFLPPSQATFGFSLPEVYKEWPRRGDNVTKLFFLSVTDDGTK